MLVQSLAANHVVRLASRELKDYLYLADERLPDPERRPVPYNAQVNLGEFMYSDLRTEEKDSVVRAIDSLQHNPHLDYLTFKRIQKAVADTLNRDEWGVHNLTNSLVSFGLVKVSGRRREVADGGYTYEFDTFALNQEHEDVRRALS